MDENWFPYAHLGASVFSGMVWAALFPVDGKRGAAAPALAVCVIGLIVLAVVVWLLWLFVSVFLKSTEGFGLGWKLFYASFSIIPAACIGIWSKCGKFIKAVVGRLIVGGMVLGLLYSIVIQSENRPSYETQIVVNPNAVSMAELKKLHRAGIKLPWEYHAATVSPAR
jgi:hypothetical protein